MDNTVKLETISQLHEATGYEKPKHPLVSVIDLSKIKTGPVPKNTKIIQDLYSVTLKEFACGILKYGRRKIDFQEGSLLCISPDQVLTIETDELTNGFEPAKGWALYFHPDLIRRSSLGSKMHEYTFFSYDTEEALHLSDKEREILFSIIQKIDTEINLNIDNFTQDLIVSNIELLLNYCKRFYSRQFITRSSMNHDITVKFEHFIKGYISSGLLETDGIPSVKFCGKQLALSPNYLSDLLKKETGKNTQEHIHYHVMEKAKTLLLSTEKSVSEIAYELGFEYPQYFSKLFKSRNGITPGNYRK